MPPADAGRRALLGTLASGVPAAALLGISAAPAVAAPPEPSAPEDLFALARLRNYSSRRSSSWDRSGGNADWVRVEPGHAATLLDIAGSGVITHLWFTINSPDPMHLKNLVLRAWWDGEAAPSVEVPIGDFFGLGLGEYFVYQSALTAVAPIKALNAYFTMPFSSAARLTLTNEGTVPVHNLYFAVDYLDLPALPEGLGRFHAQYRQAAPCKAVESDGKNLAGRDNYVFLEAAGRGHFLGVTHAVMQNENGWFGEGDDMIFIDGESLPRINGTGTEDYYNGAWDFGGQAFSNLHQGAPYIVDPERIGGRYCLYRWHLEGPIAFAKSIRVTIEHGAANNRADSYYSAAFWYQTEPHAAFPPLPPPAERVPRVFAVGGPTGPAPLPAAG
ncbi:MAG: glycoside hydrolase family 172 protein [Acidobacteriota bacterium]